jgi:hypothetical protein
MYTEQPLDANKTAIRQTATLARRIYLLRDFLWVIALEDIQKRLKFAEAIGPKFLGRPE